MKKIFKVEIEPNSIRDQVHECFFNTHTNAKPISVGIQRGQVVLWVEVETDNPEETQCVYSIGTGFGKVPDNARFVGTVQQGSFVWHIYSPE